MYKCDICGRDIKKKNMIYGYCLCSKHMHQLINHGRFLDNIPRTIKDLNGYVIRNNIVIFDLYSGITSEKIDEFYIDLVDIERVKYHKWRLSHSHVVTGSKSKGTQRELSWVIMGLDNRDERNRGIVVDHIDGNPKNNTRSNLRICTQSQNVLNKKSMCTNKTGFMGVSYREDRNCYDPEIRIGYIRCHLGQTKSMEEAVYKRMIAEQILFGEFQNQEENNRKLQFTKNIPQERKIELENITISKLRAKNLCQ